MRRLYRYLIFLALLLAMIGLEAMGVGIGPGVFLFFLLVLFIVFTRSDRMAPPITIEQLSEEENPVRPRWWLHLVLFALTFVTTTWAGALQQGVDLLHEPGRFAAGLPYSILLLAVLGVHEAGHYFAARHYGRRASPPYFIPVPFALGTFGAFINLKGAAASRNAAFGVAAAGPLAGLAVAIPALAVGLTRSQVISGNPLHEGIRNGADLHSSLFLAALARLVRHDAAAGGHHLAMHPLAFAAWIGIFITALNLMPVGQLDGGHIAHSAWGKNKAHAIGVGAVWLLVILGVLIWPGFLTWALIAYFLVGTHDAAPLDDITPLSTPRKLLAWALFAFAATVLLPVPAGLSRAMGIHSPYF